MNERYNLKFIFKSLVTNRSSLTKTQSGVFQRSLPVLEESVNAAPFETVRMYQASVFSNEPGKPYLEESHMLKPDLVANTSGAITDGIIL